MLDPSDDLGISRSMEHFVPEARRIDFDGVNDATLHLTPQYVYAVRGPEPIIDSHVLRKRGNVHRQWHILWLRHCDQFTREYCATCEDDTDVRAAAERLAPLLWRCIPTAHLAFWSLVEWNRLTKPRAVPRVGPVTTALTPPSKL